MILAILQARTSSSRLPGKVMMPLAGMPMLARQIERIARARKVDELIVATSDRIDDDCVAELALTAGAGVFRGSLDDVLDRFFRAALTRRPSHVVRLTGDCPLADWDVIDAAVEFMIEGGYDYASNTLEPTWPDGLDVEVITFTALEAAWREAVDPLEREHVMPFVTRRPDRFKLGSLRNQIDLSEMRWTVDEPADYAFAGAVYDALYVLNPAFTTADVLALLRRQPELGRVNAVIIRNGGFIAALSSSERNGCSG